MILKGGERLRGILKTFKMLGIVFASQVHLKGFIWFRRHGENVSREQVRAGFSRRSAARMRHNAVCKLWKQRAKFHLEECSGDFGTFNAGIVFASQVPLKGVFWFVSQGGTSQERVSADVQ